MEARYESNSRITDYNSDFDGLIQHFFENVARYGPPRIELNFEGKNFGVWDRRNDTYTIHRDPKKHFFKRWQSYGVSEAILKGLRQQNVRAVILEERGVTGVIRLGVSIQRFFNSGLRHRNEEYPFEVQCHVRLKDWGPITGRWKM